MVSVTNDIDSIKNVIALSEFERDLLKKGEPIHATVKTLEGEMTIAIALCCSWNSDTRKEIEREPNRVAEKVITIAQSKAPYSSHETFIKEFDGAEIYLTLSDGTLK